MNLIKSIMFTFLPILGFSSLAGAEPVTSLNAQCQVISEGGTPNNLNLKLENHIGYKLYQQGPYEINVVLSAYPPSADFPVISDETSVSIVVLNRETNRNVAQASVGFLKDRVPSTLTLLHENLPMVFCRFQ